MKFTILTKLLFVCCLLTASFSHAQTTEPKYSNAALLKAWEDNQRSQPTTVRFEKTKDANIYNFETTLFPYKGKVVVHNVLIHDGIEHYGDYDAKEASEIMGLIEAELIDAPERFRKTLHASIHVWQNQGEMYYFTDTQSWMTASEWQKWKKSTDILKPSKTKENETVLKDNFIALLPFLIILGAYIFFARGAIGGQKSFYQKTDLSLEQQKEIIKLQKEQNDLLKQILSKKE